MKYDVPIQDSIVIPESELEITTSRAGGPGGQHVNKTDSRITIRWNASNTNALNQEQKSLVLQNLQARLTNEGDLIVHNSESRSQLQNKEIALANLAEIIRKALKVPKKRMATKVSRSAKEARLQSKSRHSSIKQARSKKIHID